MNLTNLLAGAVLVTNFMGHSFGPAHMAQFTNGNTVISVPVREETNLFQVVEIMTNLSTVTTEIHEPTRNEVQHALRSTNGPPMPPGMR